MKVLIITERFGRMELPEESVMIGRAGITIKESGGEHRYLWIPHAKIEYMAYRGDWNFFSDDRLDNPLAD